MKIPFYDIRRMHEPLMDRLDDAYRRVMSSGQFILGKEVEAFEAEYARYSGVEYCVGVGNGLDGLTLLLMAYGIGTGDEVIVPANTYVATWLAISRVGATVIPVEPDPKTFNINPALIEDAVSARTVAIMPVHLYGRPAEMDKINRIAQKKGLLVIADAAQSQGALYKGKPVDLYSDSSATSFYPGKNLGALGDGGAVLTNDRAIYEKVKILRNYGSAKKYYNAELGINSRLDELQAAILREKLPFLDLWNENRRDIAKWYWDGLSNVSGIILPELSQEADIVWHQFVVRSTERDSLMDYLQKSGIGTMIHYPVPPHLQSCYQNRQWPQLKLTEIMARTQFSLPVYPGLEQDEVQLIIDTIKSFYSS